nr:ParB/RepB/Spo0J family partition protein [uncultured Blautia sp.]
MKKLRPGEMVQIKTVEELLGVVNEESAMDIEIYKIRSFQGHPFKVVDDDKMLELVESIKANGVLSPVLIRPCGNDLYEMISGHRRLHAAKLAGLTAIPSIIREMTDDEATIAMVDANIQREELLPSEKAWAYKMKLEAMKHQGDRTDITSGQIGQKLTGAVSRDILAEQVGESSKQVQRYVRLTELVPELLDLVDAKRLNFTVAVDVSYIDKEIQGWLNEYIHDNGPVKANQIAALREAIAMGPMTQMKMIMILNDTQPGKKPSGKFIIPDKKLREYFPKEYSTDEMRSVIFALLDQWKNGGANGEI